MARGIANPLALLNKALRSALFNLWWQFLILGSHNVSFGLIESAGLFFRRAAMSGIGFRSGADIHCISGGENHLRQLRRIKQSSKALPAVVVRYWTYLPQTFDQGIPVAPEKNL